MSPGVLGSVWNAQSDVCSCAESRSQYQPEMRSPSEAKDVAASSDGEGEGDGVGVGVWDGGSGTGGGASVWVLPQAARPRASTVRASVSIAAARLPHTTGRRQGGVIVSPPYPMVEAVGLYTRTPEDVGHRTQATSSVVPALSTPARRCRR